jgi:hypothetical protein
MLVTNMLATNITMTWRNRKPAGIRPFGPYLNAQHYFSTIVDAGHRQEPNDRGGVHRITLAPAPRPAPPRPASRPATWRTCTAVT